jgi:hypothetical protein
MTLTGNILCQDNKSTILLEQNGKRSSSACTWALNIRYFFLTDQIKKGNLIVEYCPTTEMVAEDYFSKPLQGRLFQKFRKAIMGNWISSHYMIWQECVGLTYKYRETLHPKTPQHELQHLTLYENY